MALTDEDLKNIKSLIGVTIDEIVEEKELATKDMLSHLPTKTEFYEYMDKIMKEIKAIRVSQEILTAKVYKDHEPRIKEVESKVLTQSS